MSEEEEQGEVTVAEKLTKKTERIDRKGNVVEEEEKEVGRP